MSESAQQKAALALLERRVRVIRATDTGVVIQATSSTVFNVTYLAQAVRTDLGPVRECACPHGRLHGPRARCWHSEVAELLLGRDETSAR